VKTPAQLIASFVAGFEGTLSVHPDDNGNWFDPGRFAAGLPQRRNMGALVGSMRGVTAYAWCTFHGRKTCSRTDIAAISLADAIAIGVALFYDRPGLKHLVWNRVTASILDKAWGSGAGSVIMRLQREIGAVPDGKISAGGQTATLYAAWIARLGEDGAARRWCEIRKAWDLSIATNEGPQDPDRLFLNGWNRRSESFLPRTTFWKDW
jgi:lysozyme family protein